MQFKLYSTCTPVAPPLIRDGTSLFTARIGVVDGVGTIKIETTSFEHLNQIVERILNTNPPAPVENPNAYFKHAAEYDEYFDDCERVNKPPLPYDVWLQTIKQ